MPQLKPAQLRDALRVVTSSTGAPSPRPLPGEGTRPGPADIVARGAPAPAPAARPSLAVREMLQRLPVHLLHHTASRHPHVLEAIARDWADPARMNATLDALVFDERGGRAGFAPEVMMELAELRACYERWVGPRSARGR